MIDAQELLEKYKQRQREIRAMVREGRYSRGEEYYISAEWSTNELMIQHLDDLVAKQVALAAMPARFVCTEDDYNRFVNVGPGPTSS